MSDEVEKALAPVRAYLLREAEAEASRILDEARAQAGSIRAAGPERRGRDGPPSPGTR